MTRPLAQSVFLLALFASLSSARTDLSGCTSTTVVYTADGEPYASALWYVPGSGEICAFLDCGGGAGAPVTTVPGCADYSGTATYSPSYVNLQDLSTGVIVVQTDSAQQQQQQSATVSISPSASPSASNTHSASVTVVAPTTSQTTGTNPSQTGMMTTPPATTTTAETSSTHAGGASAAGPTAGAALAMIAGIAACVGML